MTLCIAAIANEPDTGSCIVSCFDKRGENKFTSAQTEMKFRYLGGYWFALLAGDIFQANELIGMYRAHLRDRELSKDGAIEELRKPVEAFREKLVNRLVASRFSMTYREFLAIGAQFPADIYRDTCSDIVALELDCELILLGFVERHPMIFIVDQDCSVSTDDWLGFAAIGSGSTLAEAWLNFREQTKWMALGQTMYHLWEAKKFADRAPGVGEKTELTVLSLNSLRYMSTWPDDDELEKELNALWALHGPHPTLGVGPSTKHLLRAGDYPPKSLNS